MILKLEVELPARWFSEIEVPVARFRDIKEWKVQNDMFMYKPAGSADGDATWREIPLYLMEHNEHNMEVPLAVRVSNGRNEKLAYTRER